MSLKVEIRKVSKVKPHPNASNLEIIKCGSSTCVVQKDTFQEGDKCIFFPKHSVLPKDIFDKIFFDVNLKHRDTRIRRMRVRGQESDGLAIEPDTFELQWLESGADVTSLLRVTEYVPKKEWSEDDIDVSFIRVLTRDNWFTRFLKMIFG